MRARERPAQACAQSTDEINYAGVIATKNASFFTLLRCLRCLQYRLVASDFEEHLGHGVDEKKKATDVLKFRLWLYMVKKRTSSGRSTPKWQDMCSVSSNRMEAGLAGSVPQN